MYDEERFKMDYKLKKRDSRREMIPRM